MTKPDYLRTRRQQLTAAGKCHRCHQAATGFLCDRCKRETSDRARTQMQRSRLTRAFLAAMALLAENRCVVCQQPKDRFHPWYCRQHRRRAA